MIQFEIDDCRKKRLLEKFKNNCDNEIIFKCYKNKLELNCTYQTEIEEKIKLICEKAHIDEEETEWWIDLLD